jgi:hypothetical protein
MKRPEREADHFPAISDEVKKMRINEITPPYTFMVRLEIIGGKVRGKETTRKTKT